MLSLIFIAQAWQT